ncbi:uncharacterized protein LOC144877770 [Branchiostoma floridae x Branchiostoma japonicum]
MSLVFDACSNCQLPEPTTAWHQCVQELSASSFFTQYNEQYDQYNQYGGYGYGGYQNQQQYIYYNANNLIDGRTDTYWCSNSGHGTQHWLWLKLMPGVHARSFRLTLVPQPPGMWTENHRPEKVTALTGDDVNNMAALETVHIGREQREITLNIDAEKPCLKLMFEMKTPSDCIVSQLSIIASKRKAEEAQFKYY